MHSLNLPENIKNFFRWSRGCMILILPRHRKICLWFICGSRIVRRFCSLFKNFLFESSPGIQLKASKYIIFIRHLNTPNLHLCLRSGCFRRRSVCVSCVANPRSQYSLFNFPNDIRWDISYYIVLYYISYVRPTENSNPSPTICYTNINFVLLTSTSFFGIHFHSYTLLNDASTPTFSAISHEKHT